MKKPQQKLTKEQMTKIKAKQPRVDLGDCSYVLIDNKDSFSTMQSECPKGYYKNDYGVCVLDS